MVSSRDSLIQELNDRVSVFEEDKVVLKAALRQLQKEMKDEAPKTQQLVSDLDAAKDGMYHDLGRNRNPTIHYWFEHFSHLDSFI